MQQYDDHQPDITTSEDRQDPHDGATNNIDADDAADPSPPRGDKSSNSHTITPSVSIAANAHPPKSSETTDEDEDYEEEPPSSRILPVSNGGGGYWRAASRPQSPSDAVAMADNVSDNSSMMVQAHQRPKSRVDLATSRYSNLSYWRARRVLFFKNGDPFFPGIELRFKPGRDIGSLEALLDKLSQRMDLPRGARFIFSMDGDRKYRLDELEDGASYVVSSYKTFKVGGFL